MVICDILRRDALPFMGPRQGDLFPTHDNPETGPFLPLLLLGTAVLLWGTSFAAMKIALTGFEPMAVVWFRMMVGSAIILPLWSRIPKPNRLPGDTKWLLLLIPTAATI